MVTLAGHVLRTLGPRTPVTAAVPGSFAIADAVKGGILNALWTGSYNDRDTIVFYNAADDSEIGRGKADDLSDIVGSLVNDLLYTIYAKTTADNINFSAASNSDTATPTAVGSVVTQTVVGSGSARSGVR